MRSIMKMLFVSVIVLSFAITFTPAYIGAEECAEATLQQVSINTGSVEELTQVKGIGAEKAKMIIDYRKAHGPFETVEDLTKVKGISLENVKEIKDNITVK